MSRVDFTEIQRRRIMIESMLRQVGITQRRYEKLYDIFDKYEWSPWVNIRLCSEFMKPQPSRPVTEKRYYLDGHLYVSVVDMRL